MSLQVFYRMSQAELLLRDPHLPHGKHEKHTPIYRNQSPKVSVNSKQLCIFVLKPYKLVVQNLPASAGDMGSIPGLERSPRGGNGYPLQYSCLEISMDRGAWRATVLRVAQNQTWLKWLNTLSLLILLHVDIKQEPSQSNRVHPYSILVEQRFWNICNNITIPFYIQYNNWLLTPTRTECVSVCFRYQSF